MAESDVSKSSWQKTRLRRETALINIWPANQLQRHAAIKKKESKFPRESKLVNSGAKLFYDRTIFLPGHPLSA
jgi:hypothetical protein